MKSFTLYWRQQIRLVCPRQGGREERGT